MAKKKTISILAIETSCDPAPKRALLAAATACEKTKMLFW